MVRAGRPPADDLPEFVTLARVRAADRSRVAAGIRLLAAVLVVGQRTIDFGLVRVGGDPFRAVHRRGLDRGRGHPCVDTNLGLGRHARRLRCQRQPFAGAAGVETGGIERALVEQRAVAAAGRIHAVRDIAVEIFAALVIAHVDDNPAVGSDRNFGILVLEAAESRTLLRRRPGIERIDFDNIAGPVRFVGMPGDIEAFVGCRPGVAPVLVPDAVALECGRKGQRLIAGREVAVEVLLAGQIGAPRRAAVAAVVPGAKRADAHRIGLGLEQVVAGGRSGDLHRRVGRDAAVERRILHDLPFAVRLRDFHDGDAVGRLALAHVVRVLRLHRIAHAIGDRSVGIFVVDRQDAAPAGREQGHAVGIVAERQFLGGAGAAGRRIEGFALAPQRIAPAHDDVPAVSLRHAHRVLGAGGDRLERQTAASGARLAGGQRRCTAQERARADGDDAAQKAAAGYGVFDHPVESGLFRPRIVNFVEPIEREFCAVSRLLAAILTIGHSCSLLRKNGGVFRLDRRPGDRVCQMRDRSAIGV